MRPNGRSGKVSFILAFVFAGLGSVGAREPFYEGLGDYTRKVTTESAEAQRYFDQGLAFLHGFNHSAAIRSFQQAAELDPACAMAHWGIALASGPHINYPLVPPAAAALASREIALAREHAAKGTRVEQALIDALARRYAQPQPEDRAPLDQAYAKAMRAVWKQFPKDPDAGVLFAEAMMDLAPWNQWTPEGKANPGTEEIIATLDAVLKLNPRHPFANHLYIHAVEASPHPERADAAAARLRRLQPGLAHNVHMPSHIDIRRGRWQQAIASNAQAIADDRKYRELLGAKAPGLVPLYAAHNQHMLAYAALMTGQSQLAQQTIREMVTDLPADFLRENAPMIETFVALPLEVMIRLGRWDEILAEPENYPDYMPFTRAFHHAARAVAFAAKGQPEAARKEQAIFRERAAAIPEETALGNNTGQAVLALTGRMLEGEILVAENQVEQGLAELRAALALEEGLKYDEPPSWMIPLRHAIGANLMREGRFAEAEKIYREDLQRLPGNGWGLFGLAESLRAQKKPEAAAARARFEKAWSHADLQITSSCLCRPGL